MTVRTVDPVIVPFTALVTAGTPIAAPTTFAPALPLGQLEVVDLQIPPGHAGATGVRFTYSGQQIVPWSNTVAWIVGDNLTLTLPVDFQISDGLRVVAYNVGNFDHSFFIRFRVRQLPANEGRPTLTLVTNAALSQPSAG